LKASMRIENSLRKDGYLFVCGIDEVGRGCLAGPLVAASVILPANWRKPLKDSKMLSAKARSELNDYISAKALASGIGWVDNSEIDDIGLTQSVRLAYLRALEDMNTAFSCAIIDGNYNYLDDFEVARTLVKADQKVACVAAASIIAKVARDKYMKEQSVSFEGYDFENNVGYAAPRHILKLKSNGITSLHRRSFCRKYL
jgi:ribonuclease HII